MQGKFREGSDCLRRALDIVTDQNLPGYFGYVHAVSCFAVAGLSDWEGFDHHLACAREYLQKWPMVERDIAECSVEAARLACEARQPQRARGAWKMAREQWVELDEPDEVAAIDTRLEALDAGN